MVINVIDKLYIVPCTGETVGLIKKTEEYPYRFDTKNNKKIKNKELKCSSYDYLHIQENLKTRTKKCTYDNSLEYLEYLYKSKCNKINDYEIFWKNTIKEMIKISSKVKNDKIDYKKNKDNYVLISHHNKLKKILFPINKIAKKYSFASCSCIKLEFKNKDLNIKIITGGFPDKAFKFIKNKNNNNYDIKSSKYIYITNTYQFNKIFNKNKLKETIIKALGKNIQDFNLYIIRDGNSINSKPFSSMFKKYEDPNLSPIGIYQSKILGNLLKDELNGNIFLFTSDLIRSQQTALNLLSGLNIDLTLNKKLVKLTKKLNLLGRLRLRNNKSKKQFEQNIQEKINKYIEIYNNVQYKYIIKKNNELINNNISKYITNNINELLPLIIEDDKLLDKIKQKYIENNKIKSIIPRMVIMD